ncbi:MAG: UBP-type zinc finger domain-containing protein [Bacteroidota bacterium]
MLRPKICQHLHSFDESQQKKPKAYECESCVKSGGTWVHLRTCQSCGVTLCCDSSPARHASAHFTTTGHPIVTSAEPGERWAWCYADKSILQF